MEAEKGIPSGPAGKHADEGTLAHAYAEWCLTQHNAAEFPQVADVSDEMMENVQVYQDTVLARQTPTSTLAVEVHVDFKKLKDAPEEMSGGTCDARTVDTASGWLDIDDLKYGKGVVVEVIDNSQLKMYALASYLGLKPDVRKHIKNVRYTVIQPRAEHEDGPVRSDTISVKALKAWGKFLVERANAALDPAAPRTAGEWCRWCKAKGQCRTYDERALAVAQTEFAIVSTETVTLVDPGELSPEQERYILINAPILREWLKTVEARGLDKAMAGNPPLDMALRAKRGTRKWTNPDELDGWAATEGITNAELYEVPKLKSPAQVEKLLKPLKLKLPSDLTVTVSSGYALCEASDPRALPTGVAEFEILPDPDTEETE